MTARAVRRRRIARLRNTIQEGLLFGVGKSDNIRRFEKIPAHKLYPARVNYESLFQLENASNQRIACMQGDSSSIFGASPGKAR